MKPTFNINRLLLQSIFVFFCLFAMHSIAQADMIDDIAKALSYAGEPLKAQFTSTDLRSVKSYITCMGDGNDVGVCTNDFLNSPIGQQLGIPSWVEIAINLYVDVKEGAYWEMFTKYGEPLTCALAMFCAGFDICGTVEVMAQTVETVHDSAKAVVDLFAEFGEAAWNVAKDAYCATLGKVFGGCDSGSSPPSRPAYEIAYAKFFAPSLASGEALRAMEDVKEETFTHLQDTLIQNATSDQCFGICVVTAYSIFLGEVVRQWSGDIVARVLKELGGKRNEYNNPQQIAAATQRLCDDNTLSLASNTVPSICSNYFKTTLGYAHVDRWISLHSQDAQQLSAKSNEQWCKEIFWDGNKSKFAAAFRYCIRNKCPETGEKLLCSSVEDFNNCKSIMAQVGQDTQCDFTPESALKGKCPKDSQTQMYLCSSSDDYKFCRSALSNSYFQKQDQCGFTAPAAYDSAKKLDNYFKSNGSTIPCSYTIPAQPNKPVDFICSRPKQNGACNQYHESPFVNCVLNEDLAYKALKDNVNRVVMNLQSKYYDTCSKGPAFRIDAAEPLLVDCLYFGLPDQYEIDISQNFGFEPPSLKHGFDILKKDQKPMLPFDGLSTPTMFLQPPNPRCLQQPTATPIDILKSKKPTPDMKNISPAISPTTPTKR